MRRRDWRQQTDIVGGKMATRDLDAIQPDRKKLIDAALRIYLKKARRELADGNPWRTASSAISMAEPRTFS
jgi:hypothetical protein